MRLTLISISCALVGLALVTAVAGPRVALWRVVQACVADHELFGEPFPCLLVETSQGRDAGYAVLRAPIDDVKVIVTPTVRTIGIEDPRLRGPDAPNYFADAWAARHFATDGLAKPPSDADIAMALNSRPGRSQDQLHIHIACLSPQVRRALDREASKISAQRWARMKPLPGAPYYLAHVVAGADLATTNVIDLATEGLGARPRDIDGITIVVTPTTRAPGQPAGFTILARKRLHAWDEPHGEGLLDQNCELAERR